MDNTSLGDRMKGYEKLHSFRAMPGLPVIARLDGRAFHTWTKGLNRPFDNNFIGLMQHVTKSLIEETNAIIGYTQSDEITLIYYSDNPASQIFFDGKIQKMNSVLASMCTAYFNEPAKAMWPEKPLAFFDCRVFQVPSKEEAVNCLVWREMDAVRNSILSVAQSKFSYKEMQGKNTSVLQEMLFQKHGINWGEDYPSHLKRGTYFKRVKVEREFTHDELANLPPKHAAHKNPNLKVVRSDTKMMDYPRLTRLENRVEVIFDANS